MKCFPFSILLSLFVALLSSSIFGDQAGSQETSFKSKAPAHFRLLKGANSRAKYEYDLLKLVLENSRDQFGEYKLDHINYAQGTARGRRELAKGEQFNINISPIRPRGISDKEDIIIIPSPVMKGLLGYRALVSHKSQTIVHSNIKNLDHLKQRRIGQARGWLDNDIYRHSGIPVVDTGTYFQLFPMLARKRFELLALGIIEVESAIEQEEKAATHLAIVPNLIVYYPFPVVFQISGQYPSHAKRIELGLERVKANGKFDQLFEDYFASIYRRFLSAQTSIVSIENPLLENTMGLTEKELLVFGD